MIILIVEDSFPKYEKVKIFLEKNNIQSERAKSYESAINLLSKIQYDGVFLDMQFPFKDTDIVSNRQQGTKVLEKMKELGINTPVCIHTSFQHLDFRHEPLVRKYIKYEVGINLEKEYQCFIDMIKK